MLTSATVAEAPSRDASLSEPLSLQGSPARARAYGARTPGTGLPPADDELSLRWSRPPSPSKHRLLRGPGPEGAHVRGAHDARPDAGAANGPADSGAAALSPAAQRADEIQRVLREARVARAAAEQAKWIRQKLAENSPPDWKRIVRHHLSANGERVDEVRVAREAWMLEHHGAQTDAVSLGMMNSELQEMRRILSNIALTLPDRHAAGASLPPSAVSSFLHAPSNGYETPLGSRSGSPAKYTSSQAVVSARLPHLAATHSPPRSPVQIVSHENGPGLVQEAEELYIKCFGSSPSRQGLIDFCRETMRFNICPFLPESPARRNLDEEVAEGCSMCGSPLASSANASPQTRGREAPYFGAQTMAPEGSRRKKAEMGLPTNMTAEDSDGPGNRVHAHSLAVYKDAALEFTGDQTEDAFQHIIDVMWNGSGLKRLILSSGSLGKTPSRVSELAQPLAVNSTLVSLDLSDNQIDCLAMALLATSMCSNTTLQYLSLARNRLRANSGRHLAQALKINRSIHALDVSSNLLGPSGCSCVAMALNFNTCLTELRIMDNRAGDDAACFFSETLKRHAILQHAVHLRSLDLAHNAITDFGGQALLRALEHNNSITHLNLAGNPMQKELLDSIQLLVGGEHQGRQNAECR